MLTFLVLIAKFMATVKFLSVDKNARTATFDVDGVEITRKIPNEFVGTIDTHLTALANGLSVEFAPTNIKTIETPEIKAGDEVVGK